MLATLDKTFKEGGKSNEFFGIPAPDENHHLIEEDYDWSETDPDAENFFNANVELLNEQQRHIFQVLTNCIDSNQGGFYNIDAPGGTGKTFLCNVILA